MDARGCVATIVHTQCLCAVYGSNTPLFTSSYSSAGKPGRTSAMKWRVSPILGGKSCISLHGTMLLFNSLHGSCKSFHSPQSSSSTFEMQTQRLLHGSAGEKLPIKAASGESCHAWEQRRAKWWSPLKLLLLAGAPCRLSAVFWVPFLPTATALENIFFFPRQFAFGFTSRGVWDRLITCSLWSRQFLLQFLGIGFIIKPAELQLAHTVENIINYLSVAKRQEPEEWRAGGRGLYIIICKHQ